VPSVLESAPYDDAMYAVYGHTATVAELAELARDTGRPDATMVVLFGVPGRPDRPVRLVSVPAHPGSRLGLSRIRRDLD
jgi:hypothetical protein